MATATEGLFGGVCLSAVGYPSSRFLQGQQALRSTRIDLSRYCAMQGVVCYEWRLLWGGRPLREVLRAKCMDIGIYNRHPDPL